MDSRISVGSDLSLASFGRREFLRGTVAGAAVLGTGGLLAACSSGSSPAGKTALPVAQPKRGGTLRAGLTEGTSSDTLDPVYAINNLDLARANALYDPLIRFDRTGRPTLYLAAEMTPNATATEWSIRLRDGVTFHDGKPLTADDLIYSFQRIMNPKEPGTGAASLSGLDAANIKKLDNLTARLPFSRPFSTLPALLAAYYYFVLPVGFDPTHPVGTGPYRYQSFSPGVQSTFIRNDHYWVNGLPYTDALVLDDIADETTGANGLMSGQLDCFDISSPVLIPELQASGVQVVVSPGGGFIPFVMRVDSPPFTDVRVRQAFRLIVDRKQMIELCWGGHGTLGNDVFSIWDPMYDHSLPQREQDIEQARSLLKSAGQDNLSIQLVTAPIQPGATQQATVFAQQAEKAGVSVALRQVTPTELFGPNYLKWTFTQDYWYYTPYFAEVAQSTLPNSPFWETHFDDAYYNQLYSRAESTTVSSKQASIAHEMQAIDYDQGGYIIPCFFPVLDAHLDSVGGVQPSKLGLPFNMFDFKSLWLT
jgi:peptide/nickel transport system substrate-binding protein